MVSPRFTAPSFWNYRATCEAVGVRCPVPPLSLITVAAMLPSSWDVRLIDRNTDELTSADLDRVDLVMTGGMMAQETDTLEIIKICRARGIPVVVGGAGVTSSPHLYDDADFQVQGEAEDIMAVWRMSKEKDIRRHLWSTVFDCALHNLPALEAVLFMAALYLHLGPFSRYVRACVEQQIASIDSSEMREFSAASVTRIGLPGACENC
jgi:hypothetical protein